ncbi:MAG: glycine cleavage system aminomethyltransferase GcvT [Microthrixaceae bacterium]
MRHSPLDSVHRALEAKMVGFGGWEMPIAYPSGTVAEHLACRSDAVIFDVSHLGTVRVSGPDALATLQRAFTNDLEKIEPGRAQYTHLLDPETASVTDDIIVWWVSQQEFDVMPNASNTDGVRDALSSVADQGADLRIVDTTTSRAVLAIQGPAARAKLAEIAPDAAAVGRFRVIDFKFQGADCVAAGTGYTGEDGVECAVPVAVAEDFWNAVTAKGVIPAGLGARDTLRLEAGLPLHGHELGGGITTLEAGLGWVVSWTKGDFIGRDVLERQKTDGVTRALRGLVTEGRRPPREGQNVMRDGEQVGVTTSGNFSPTLGHGIALAFLSPEIEPGDNVDIDLRGTAVPAKVVKLPFVARQG